MFRKVMFGITVACFIPMIVDTIKRRRMRKDFNEWLSTDFEKTFDESTDKIRQMYTEDGFLKDQIEEMKLRS